jgi:hypothetical protein
MQTSFSLKSLLSLTNLLNTLKQKLKQLEMLKVNGKKESLPKKLRLTRLRLDFLMKYSEELKQSGSLKDVIDLLIGKDEYSIPFWTLPENRNVLYLDNLETRKMLTGENINRSAM